jgi:hypothetical protein
MPQLHVAIARERRHRPGGLVPFSVPGPERIMRPIYAVQPSSAEPTPQAARFMTLMMEAHRTPGLAIGGLEGQSAAVFGSD